MVAEYVQRLYMPAGDAQRTIAREHYAPARELSAWKSRVRAAWPTVAVAHVESGGVESPQLGDELHVRAHIELGGLTADDVSVEVVFGRAGEGDDLAEVHAQTLALVTHEIGHPAAFAGSVPLRRSGSFGYNVRVTPRHALLANPAELGLVAVAH